MKKNILKYGLIATAIYFIFDLVAFFTNLSLFVNFLSMAIPILVFATGVIAQVVTKKEHGGFLSFGKTFTVYAGAIGIAIVLNTILLGVLFNLVRPEAKQEVYKLSIKQSLEMVQGIAKMASGDEDVNEEVNREMENAMNDSMEQNQNSSFGKMMLPYGPLSLVLSVFSAALMFGIGGLISALIIRKEPQPDFQHFS